MILKVKALRSFKEKSVGLIGEKNIYPVYFTTRWGIHTFGVLFPIDVIIMDTNNRVVKIVQNLKPNRMLLWNPKYKDIIELPKDTIKIKGIKIGEKITLEES